MKKLIRDAIAAILVLIVPKMRLKMKYAQSRYAIHLTFTGNIKNNNISTLGNRYAKARNSDRFKYKLVPEPVMNAADIVPIIPNR